MRCLSLLLCTWLQACSGFISHEERQSLADSLASTHGWIGRTIPTSRFTFLTYSPASKNPSDSVTIYIEGDGQAWLNSSLPSFDPTPQNPIGLRLALAHPDGAAVYLARPCQYVGILDAQCNNRYWTSGRFSLEVIATTSEAIDHIMEQYKAHHATLVGYSGGGAVASLIAVMRTDINLLVTVASPLDHLAWSRFHHLSPLDDSLNPVEYTARLDRTPQTHFAGGEDKNMPPSIAYRFASFSANNLLRVHVERSFDHKCCWVEEWPRLWSIATANSSHWVP